MSASVADEANFLCTRCPVGNRREILDAAAGSSGKIAAARCRLLFCSSSLAACNFASSSCSLRSFSSSMRLASSCCRSRSSFSSVRRLSISSACWYSKSCCSRKFLSSTCCSRRAIISARCVSISSKHAASKPEAASTWMSPFNAPMTRISSTLAGKSTQNQGYCRAWIICETLCASMLAMSPPQRRKFSSNMPRMKSSLKTSEQNLRV
mmetsp:Transcript_52914/g.105130  ORF Transcript_52914/g.105130 Transcript_52914/m.105130 type:complete len:209 (-) Transcript_52914:576-1202(-)